GLIFFGAMVSTMVSATIGAISLCITGMQPWQRFAPIWGNWMLGDAMGDVIVAPTILTLSAATSRRRIARGALGELILLVIALIAIGAFVFGRQTALGYHPPDYAMFPVLVWAALRLGTCGTAISVVVTATLAVLGTVNGFGPYTAGY